MKRRDFFAFAAGALAWPTATQAQQTHVFRILWLSTASGADPFFDGFRAGLRALGYAEGKNIVLRSHYAPNNPQGLREVVSELKRDDVDLVVSSGPATRAMVGVTDIPVLFAQSGDPVALGIVNSLAQPGTNFTGSTFLSLELAGKRIELLKDAFPRLRRLAVLSNTDHPGEPSEWRATQEAAKAVGVEPIYIDFSGPSELDRALSAIAAVRADAMLTFPEPVTMVNRTKVAHVAASNRLPSMFGWSEYCEAGGLLSYGANQRDTYFLLAKYADRILRGEHPADLPVVQPDKFELALNLKTARLFGEDLDLSSILFRANKVLE
jgi:putative tryptophan/tyrosine transport system substrate-binding protein